jgi:hypothetical protein
MAGLVVCMGEKINAKFLLQKPMHRWEDIMKMDIEVWTGFI